MFTTSTGAQERTVREEKNRSLVSNWTNCWCGGSRKHHGLEKPRLTHYSKRFSTSIGPTRIFFERRAKFPKFHKKGVRDSFRESDQKCNQVRASPTTASNCQRLVWVRYRNSREVLGEIRSVTVSQSAGQWYVSVNTLRQVEPPRHASTAEVGIDWGVAQFITPSEGPTRRPVVPTQEFLAQAQDVAAAVGTQSKSFRITGRKRKRKSPSCTNESPTPESISYIRSRRTSAKTTPLSLSKTCK